MSINYNFPNGEYYSNPLSSSTSLPNHFSKFFGNTSSIRNQLLNPFSSRNNNFYQGTNNVIKNSIISKSSKRDFSFTPKYNLKNLRNETPTSDMMSLKTRFNSLNQKIERLNNLLTSSEFGSSKKSKNDIEKRPNSFNKILNNSNNIFSNYTNFNNLKLYSHKHNYSNILNSPSFSSFEKNTNYSNYLSPPVNKLSYDNTTNNLINSSTTKTTLDYNYSPLKDFSPSKSISLKFYSSQKNDLSNESNNLNNLKSSPLSLINYKDDINSIQISKQDNFDISPIKNENERSYYLINQTRKFINDYKSRNLKINSPKKNINLNFNIKRENFGEDNIKHKILTDTDLSKIISDLHEKRKLLVDGGPEGLERYRKLRLNQKLNIFNKRLITGDWSNLRNSYEGSNFDNFLKDHSRRKNLGVSIYYNPIKMKNENIRYDNNNIGSNSIKKSDSSNYNIESNEISNLLNLINKKKNKINEKIFEMEKKEKENIKENNDKPKLEENNNYNDLKIGINKNNNKNISQPLINEKQILNIKNNENFEKSLNNNLNNLPNDNIINNNNFEKTNIIENETKIENNINKENIENKTEIEKEKEKKEQKHEIINQNGNNIEEKKEENNDNKDEKKEIKKENDFTTKEKKEEIINDDKDENFEIKEKKKKLLMKIIKMKI